jgi:16S rRNA (guanine527-N7)-methyltransferase
LNRSLVSLESTPDRSVEDESGPVPVPAELSAAVARFFGDHLDLIQRYADLLATDGVIRGLIGPREAPRLWERHILNCVAVAELITPGAKVTDVGSGAGLPGIVLAVARPDLTITLVEPLARRTAFLTEVVDQLGLARIEVVRARAQDCVGQVSPADVVTARAVAPLDKLAAWCLPLAGVGGRVLALKGASAGEEIEAHAAAIAGLGGGTPTLRLCGVGVIEPPATVVEIVRQAAGKSSRAGAVHASAVGKAARVAGTPGRRGGG